MSAGPPAKKQKFHNKKSSYIYKSNKKHFLEAGQRGFMATCNFREKDCVRECYNVLNQYADQLYGPQPRTLDKIAALENNTVSEESDDIADALQKEITASKEQNKNVPKPRFQLVDTGTTNCLFIRTTLDDPVELGISIVKDIAETKKRKSRFLMRLVPIEAVCHANIPDILKAAGVLFDKHFLRQSCSFAIVYNKRYNNELKRDDVIKELADLVQSKNVDNRVDLKNADKSIIVEVIKGLCCLSVVEGYLQYKKYNLSELANTNETSTDDAKDTGKEKSEPTTTIETTEAAEKNE